MKLWRMCAPILGLEDKQLALSSNSSPWPSAVAEQEIQLRYSSLQFSPLVCYCKCLSGLIWGGS